MPNRPIVAVVDDDQSVRESLPDLLREFGFAAQAYSSAEEFLASESAEGFACLILDIAMPGMNGFELKKVLNLRGNRIPTIFITARRDENSRPQLLADGAAECLYKPFSDVALLAALNNALHKY